MSESLLSADKFNHNHTGTLVRWLAGTLILGKLGINGRYTVRRLETVSHRPREMINHRANNGDIGKCEARDSEIDCSLLRRIADMRPN